MSKKNVGDAVLDTMMSATMVSSMVPPGAFKDKPVAKIKKASKVATTIVGETVEFTVTLSGPAGETFKVTDELAGHTENASTPTVESITPAPGYSALTTAITDTAITVTGVFDAAGKFVYTYSVLVDTYSVLMNTVGEAMLESEACISVVFRPRYLR